MDHVARRLADGQRDIADRRLRESVHARQLDHRSARRRDALGLGGELQLYDRPSSVGLDALGFSGDKTTLLTRDLEGCAQAPGRLVRPTGLRAEPLGAGAAARAQTAVFPVRVCLNGAPPRGRRTVRGRAGARRSLRTSAEFPGGRRSCAGQRRPMHLSDITCHPAGTQAGRAAPKRSERRRLTSPRQGQEVPGAAGRTRGGRSRDDVRG